MHNRSTASSIITAFLVMSALLLGAGLVTMLRAL
jgi:hypothetical protein